MQGESELSVETKNTLRLNKTIDDKSFFKVMYSKRIV